jgi:predicted enzyme related to lactoylglutathione lyase
MRFTFTLDSDDPGTLATFWAAALGYTSVGEFGVFWPLFPADESEPVINIQRVSEPRSGKNRMHLDIHVVDLVAEVQRLTAIGATKVSEDVITEFDNRWLVMADPDGNEFCVVQRPEGVDDLGRPIEPS